MLQGIYKPFGSARCGPWLSSFTQIILTSVFTALSLLFILLWLQGGQNCLLVVMQTLPELRSCIQLAPTRSSIRFWGHFKEICSDGKLTVSNCGTYFWNENGENKDRCLVGWGGVLWFWNTLRWALRIWLHWQIGNQVTRGTQQLLKSTKSTKPRRCVTRQSIHGLWQVWILWP